MPRNLDEKFFSIGKFHPGYNHYITIEILCDHIFLQLWTSAKMFPCKQSPVYSDCMCWFDGPADCMTSTRQLRFSPCVTINDHVASDQALVWTFAGSDRDLVSLVLMHSPLTTCVPPAVVVRLSSQLVLRRKPLTGSRLSLCCLSQWKSVKVRSMGTQLQHTSIRIWWLRYQYLGTKIKGQITVLKLPNDPRSLGVVITIEGATHRYHLS